MQNPKKLEVYQEAYKVALQICRIMEGVKGSYRMKEQLTASSTAICANLAEFGSFTSTGQQLQKIKTCIGEANETELWLDMYKDLGKISEDQHKDLVNKNKVVRMKLFNLKKRIEENQ